MPVMPVSRNGESLMAGSRRGAECTRKGETSDDGHQWRTVRTVKKLKRVKKLVPRQGKAVGDAGQVRTRCGQTWKSKM